MKSFITKQLFFTVLLIGALAACTPIQAPAASTGATVTPGTKELAVKEEAISSFAAGATGVQPLASVECESIQTAIAEQLNIGLEIAESDFASEIANQQGTACNISATGTGEEFGNFVDVAQAIRNVLSAEGWTENPDYLADGPMGTASGYEKENKLALVQVDWEPSEEAGCPDDQPISACDVEPSQQIFTLLIELVQAS